MKVLLLLLQLWLASSFMMKSSRVHINKNPIIMKKKERSISPEYGPRTENQKKYVQSLSHADNDVLIAVGPAGTGKTLLACTYAVQRLREDSIQKIVLTRPIVPVEEDIGYLPGKLNSKMEPWTRPIFDILSEYYDHRTITSMLQCGVIEIAPLAYMRGRTFKNSIIIADEMQNSSPNQMMMVTTRLGENSKLLITGDLNQSDKYEDNGLKDLIEKVDTYEGNTDGIKICTFDEKDVQRSEIVSKMLAIYGAFSPRGILPRKPPTAGNVPPVNPRKGENSVVDTGVPPVNPHKGENSVVDTGVPPVNPHKGENSVVDDILPRQPPLPKIQKKTHGSQDAAMIPKRTLPIRGASPRKPP